MGETQKKEGKCLNVCATRRQFLLGSGAATATILLTGIPGLGAKKAEALASKYPRKKIAKLSNLKKDKPILFEYPSKGIQNMIVKLGTPAGGGVGSKTDVVAFNLSCSHMGGPLAGSYKKDDKVLGPCPFHLSTFDLTRYGIIVTGHATQSLPQIDLEVDGDDIYATGVFGLIYGRNENV